MQFSHWKLKIEWNQLRLRTRLEGRGDPGNVAGPAFSFSQVKPSFSFLSFLSRTTPMQILDSIIFHKTGFAFEIDRFEDRKRLLIPCLAEATGRRGRKSTVSSNKAYQFHMVIIPILACFFSFNLYSPY